jgi:uncharacterized repeat protein (TIGR03837 family)
MAPGALAGLVPGLPDLQVLPWTQPIAPDLLLQVQAEPADVWVEAFGCSIAPEFIANYHQLAWTRGDSGTQTPPKPVWINLEYLTAEPYAARSHGLPSPVTRGPGAGLTKHFFYPGFTPGTGGLLREGDLAARQASFDRPAWLQAQGIAWRGERLVSLFCYEPAALSDLLQALQAGPQPTRLLVAPGRPAAAVKTWFQSHNLPESTPAGASVLSISYLPYRSQPDFDALLWACDVNFVRGEDSVVRALWAGKPLVWQIYPQHDGAHAAKLEAFMACHGMPASQRNFHRVWNGLQPGALPALDCAAWQASAIQARQQLLAQADLTTQLTGFVAKKR